jgi:CheY-like chemotaxis protein
MNAQGPADIVLVDDDPASIQLILRILQGLGRLRVANRPDQALLLALGQARIWFCSTPRCRA